MALLGTSFQIGRSALAAYQAAIGITGQNIANVGNADYTRQSGRLAAIPGAPYPAGLNAGAGVNLSGLQRHIDEAVEARLRLSLSNRSSAQAASGALDQIEALYNELSEGDLSSQLASLFASFGSLQTDPQDTTQRNLVLQAADTLVRTFQRQRASLGSQVVEMNASVEAAVTRADAIAGEIAKLNASIVAEQARAQAGAGPLRDRRDALLRELSQYMDVQTREYASGAINVYVGSEPLVEFDRSHGLTTQKDFLNGVEVQTVRFADNNGLVVMQSGQLGGLVRTRDQNLLNEIAQLDRLAHGLIYETNRVHSSGFGLVGYTALTGTNAADDPAAALNSSTAGLDFPVQNGTFIVNVRDPASGATTTRVIRVDLDGLGAETSLNSLAADLAAVPGLTVSVTGDNRLQISVAPGREVSFSEDSSGALAALGVGAFFEGVDASSIRVAATITADPRRIAASVSGASGDGDNAGRLADLAESASALLGDVNILDFHGAMTSRLAIDTAAARNGFDAADVVYGGLLAQRESISGVSLDEEAINLTKFERSYQGATRFLTVLDTLSAEVLGLVS